MFNKDSRIT